MSRRPHSIRLAFALAAVIAPTTALAPAVFAQEEIESVTWAPRPPTVDDVVLVRISGWRHDSEAPMLARILRRPDREDFPELYPELDLPVAIAETWAIVLERQVEPLPVGSVPYEVDVALTGLPVGLNRFLVRLDNPPLVISDPPIAAPHELFEIGVQPATDTLRLHGGRFLVTVTWRDPFGNSGTGRLVPSVGSEAPAHARTSGLFSFFTPDNWEVMVKLLDGCTVNGRFWAFVAAATNVEYTLRIEDLLTGAVWEYTNPLGELSPAFADTDAFTGCDEGL